MYTSPIQKFNTYTNGKTPYIQNGNWYIDGVDQGIRAQAQDGVSFSNIKEYYLALSTDPNTVTPPTFSSSTDVDENGNLKNGSLWKSSVASTNFGGKDDNGYDYKYLWNVEGVVSYNANTKTYSITYTTPELIQIYSGGRIPKDFISYYAVSVTSASPDNPPSLDTDHNTIVNSNDEVWSTELSLQDDAEDYLFEITFIEYEQTDENGKNKYQKLSGPTCIGHNSISPTFIALNNDNEVLVRNASGTIIEPLPEVSATLYVNGQVTDATLALGVPGSFKSGDNLNSEYVSFFNNTLTFAKIPDSFSGGSFVFTYNLPNGGAITKAFNLKIIDGECDYSLRLSRTVVNSTNGEGSVTIGVQKIQSSGSPEIVYAPTDGWPSIYIGSSPTAATSWTISYNQGDTTPITITLKDSDNFVWDTEQIEFVSNGTSPYVISLDEDFASIPCDANGSYGTTFPNVTITPTVYYGDNAYAPSDWSTSSSAEGLKITLSSSNLTANWGTGDNSKKIIISDLTANRGTVTLTLSSGNTVYTSTTFEAVKNKQGESGTYVYAVTDPAALKQNNLKDIVITLYKRTGSGEPVAYAPTSWYYKWKTDSGELSSAVTVTNTSTATLAQTTYGSPTSELQINVYADAKCTTVIDKITINVVADGSDGTNVKQLKTYERTNLTEKEIRENYGKPSHVEWWWVQKRNDDGTLDPEYDNSHIKIGDTIYLVGTTSDTGLNYAIYGEYLNYQKDYGKDPTRAAIQMQTTYLVIGGSAGTNGTNGKIALSPTRHFTGDYKVNDVINSTISKDLNREPEIGEVFSNVSKSGEQMITIQIQSTLGDSWSGRVKSSVSLVGPQGPQGPRGPQGTNGTSPYSFELTNDSATVFVAADAATALTGSLLQNATQTTVIVKHGESDISNSVYYTWTTDNTTINTLNTYDGKTVKYTKLTSNTSTATVSIYSDQAKKIKLGEKTFVVSKSKEGTPGVNYRLYLSPNSYQLPGGSSAGCTVSFNVVKYTGSTASTINPTNSTECYIRKKGTTQKITSTSIAINATTTFELVNNSGTLVLDCETVTIVHDGVNGSSIKGDTGNSAARVYYGDNTYRTIGYLTENVPVINSSGSLINTWSTTKPSGKSFIYSCDLIYNPNTGKYSDAEKPKLLEATPPTNTSISAEQWATFITLTNGGESQNSFFDDAGRMYINASLINTDSLIVNKDFSVNVRQTGNSNLLAADDLVINTEGISQVSAREWTLRKSSNWSGAYVNPRILEVGKTYLLSYSLNVVSGTLKRIGGHHGTAEEKGFKFYQNSSDVTNSFFVTGGKYSSPYVLKDEHWDQVSGLVYKVAFLFTFKGGSGNNGVYIQPNRGIDDEITFNLWDVMLQEVDSIPNNLNDLVYMYPRGVAVTAGDVVTSINATPDGVAIKGDKINFSTANFVVTDNSNNIMFQATGGTQNPKVIVTNNRLFTVNAWLGYATKGVVTDWTAEQGKNGHIAVGDIAYLVGNTTDASTVNGVSIPTNTPVRVYGRVIEITSNNIKMDMLGYKFGENLVDTYSTSSIQPAVSIAGWSVKPYGFLGPLQQYTLNGVSHNKPTIGFAPVPGHGCWAIWAGQQTGDGSNNSDKAYGYDAPFHVGHSGELYAENMTLGTYKNFTPLQRINQTEIAVSGGTQKVLRYGDSIPSYNSAYIGSDVRTVGNSRLLRISNSLGKSTNSDGQRRYNLATKSNSGLHDLSVGVNYKLSGKVHIKHFWPKDWAQFIADGDYEEWVSRNFSNVGLGVEYKLDDGTWREIVEKAILSNDKTSAISKAYGGSQNDWAAIGDIIPEENAWVDFSCEFNLPEGAVGTNIYFQTYLNGYETNIVDYDSYTGYLWIKDLELQAIYAPYSFGTIHPNTGLQFWSGPTEENVTNTDDNLIFRVDENGAYIKGEIVSSNATITGGSITIKNSDNEVVFNAGPDGVTIGGYAKSSDLPNMDNYLRDDVSGTGSYSWMFSVDKGIKMWNTNDTSQDFVFGVNASGVYVNGEINTLKGTIGPWAITTEDVPYPKVNNNDLGGYYEDENVLKSEYESWSDSAQSIYTTWLTARGISLQGKHYQQADGPDKYLSATSVWQENWLYIVQASEFIRKHKFSITTLPDYDSRKTGWIGYIIDIQKNALGAITGYTKEYIYFDNGIVTKFSSIAPTDEDWMK